MNEFIINSQHSKQDLVRVTPMQTRRVFLTRSAGLVASAAVMGVSRGWTMEAGRLSAQNTTAGNQASTASGGGSLLASSPVRITTEWAIDEWNPQNPFIFWGKPLRVQPVLMYAVPQPKQERSWRSWGGVLTDETAAEELARITHELHALALNAEFPLEILQPVKVKSPEEVNAVLQNERDVMLVYPASGSGSLLQKCVSGAGDTVLFVRHRSGPIYYWYEGLSVAYLKTDETDSGSTNPPRLGDTHVEDVVVDDYHDVLWRLRALYGIKNLIGARIVALGGDWGKYVADAPQIAREKYKIDIIDIPYSDIEDRIKSALADSEKMALAEQRTETYLAMPNTTLQTEKHFVVNAFVLYQLFKELMWEHQSPAFTIKDCMSTIIPISKTTACLTLSLLNDEGLLAFCESDFVVIPAGILLRHITGKPVFLHNSTFPHKGIVTCAHCSAPRRMNAERYEPLVLLTHEESDYGAAPKVEIPIGQEVSFIDPDYTTGRWVGMRGNVDDNPFFPICRSQQDVRIQGEWKKLLNEVRDSHWLMVYGDSLNEIGYAARKLNVEWDNISDV